MAHLRLKTEVRLSTSADMAFTKLCPVPGTSWVMTACIIANAALGAGMLNFPQAFDSAGGIAVAMGVQVVSTGILE